MAIRYSSVVGGSSSNGFSLLVGSTGNTTFTFDTPQPAGAYSVTSQLGDTTFDIYFITSANQNAGYTTTGAMEATAEFNRVVVYGASTNDILNFEYKPSASPATNGDVDDGVAPFLTSATPTTLASIDDTTTVSGGNFASDVVITFTGQDAVDRPAKSIVRSSSTSLIVTRPDDFPVAQEPFTMTATNAGAAGPSIPVNVLTDYFDAGSGIVWVTSSPLASAVPTAAYSVTLQATDVDGVGVTYAVTTGALPAGLSLNSSTGEISGTPTTEETQVFTVTATDTGNNSSAREFSLQVSYPMTEYLVIAGGGGGGTNGCSIGGGGGAGGYRSSVAGELSGGGASAESAFQFSFGTNYTVTVGAGGPGEPSAATTYGSDGFSSVFATVTSTGGGGAGGGAAGCGTAVGRPGGSGGGASQNTTGGAGIAGQGFDGSRGKSDNKSYSSGGGGGGAASAGINAIGGADYSQYAIGGDAGGGLQSSITGTAIYRAGGGGGGSGGAAGGSRGGYAGIGGGGQGGHPSINSGRGYDGTVNLGGGGGGSCGGTQTGGNGSSGAIILRYDATYTLTLGAGLVGTTTTVGDKKVTQITAGTGNVSWS